jgi:signal transduction histidine kinase
MIPEVAFPNSDPRFKALRPFFLLTSTLGIVYFLMLGLQIGGPNWQQARALLFNLPLEIVAMVFLARALRIQNPNLRSIMQPFVWAVGLHVLTDILHAIFEFGFQSRLNQVRFNPIDLMYAGTSFLLIIGLLRVPLRKTTRLEVVRLSLDVSLLVLTVGVLFWTSFLDRIVQNGGQLLIPGTSAFVVANTALSRIPFNGTPIDILVLCIAVVVTMRSTIQIQRLTILVSLGITSLVLLDAAIGAQLSLGFYQQGSLVDSGFILCLSIFCLATYLSFSPQPSSLLTRQSLASLGWLSTYAPYLAAVLIYIPLIQSHLDSELQDIIGVASAAVITALVLIRQILILQENRNLTAQLSNMNNQLEARIQARTQELEDSRERLVSSEKLASIGQLTAGLAHEVNTPLAASLNYLHQARSLANEYAQSVGNPGVTFEDHTEIAKELGQSLQDTAITLERLGEFVRKMRNQTRFSSNEATLFDPINVAQDTLSMLEHQAKSAKVVISLNPGIGGTLLRGEPGRFTQVVSNLVLNAIHASEGRENARVELIFGTRIQLEQTELIFSVTDNGMGISDAILPKIFEPLFTTKPVGKGTGLGLSIIRDIVRGHFGGELEIQTQVGMGTTFKLFLPMGTNAARAGTDQARA